MKFEIKSRYNGSVLFAMETESLKLCLELAVKSGASLDGASLDHASLDHASLIGASLNHASLNGASLDHASLIGASLIGANGINKNLCTPLQILLDQPEKIHAYKLTTKNGDGVFNGGITYKIEKSYEVLDANTDDTQQCSKGINLATLDWCMKNWKENYRILIAEFTAKDIAAIPIATDGKFRVFRCKIVGEKNLVDIGLK